MERDKEGKRMETYAKRGQMRAEGLAPEAAVQSSKDQRATLHASRTIRCAISALTPVGSVRPCPVPSRFLRTLVIRAIDQEGPARIRGMGGSGVLGLGVRPR